MKKATVYTAFILVTLLILPERVWAAATMIRTANPAGVSAASTIATYSGVSIGTAADDRIVAVVVATELANSTPSAVTINSGGGAVSMNAGTTGSFSAVFARVFYLLVPTGTTADIEVTFSSVSPSNIQNHIAVYRVIGASDTLSAQNGDGSTDMDATDPLTTGSVTIPSGGAFLGVAGGATDTVAKTWANVTEDIDEDAGSLRFTTATSSTAGTATRTVTGGTNNEDGALSYVIFQSGPTTPTVTCSAASFTVSSAQLNGNITLSGGVAATTRGFAWGTNSGLSNGDTSTTTETGTLAPGAFAHNISTLKANTTYYFRGYATNSQGTSYCSSILNFTTSADPGTISRRMRLFEGHRVTFIDGRILIYQQ